MADSADVPPLVAEDHVCESCDMRYLDLNQAAAAEAIRSYPARYRSVLAGVPLSELRRRPAADVWSMLEYLCHVRDVYDVYCHRIHRTRTEDDPVLEPMRNTTRAARDRYNEQDPESLLEDLTRNAERFAALVDTIEPAERSRTARRLPGETRTLLWLARQAAHEGIHHLHDIEHIRDQREPTLRSGNSARRPAAGP